MALIVETGEKVANANSYVDLAFAASYHTALGNDAWAGDAAVLEEALIVACRALDQLYGLQYLGRINRDSTQVLLWPRTTTCDAHGRSLVAGTIPTCLKEAQCEIALLHRQGIDVFPTQADAAVKSSTVQIGAISESYEFYKPVQKETFTGFRRVELILTPILKKVASGWRLRA